MCFIFAELGTTGNQDANGHLILKGKVIANANKGNCKCKFILVQCKEYGEGAAAVYQRFCTV